MDIPEDLLRLLEDKGIEPEEPAIRQHALYAIQVDKDLIADLLTTRALTKTCARVDDCRITLEKVSTLLHSSERLAEIMKLDRAKIDRQVVHLYNVTINLVTCFKRLEPDDTDPEAEAERLEFNELSDRMVETKRAERDAFMLKIGLS